MCQFYWHNREKPTPPPIAMLLQTTHRCIHGKMLGKNLPLYPNDNIEMGERGTKQCIRKRLMCVHANNFGKDCTFLFHFFGNVSCIFSQDHIEHSTIILKHMKFLFMFTSPFLFMCNFLNLPLKVNSSHMYSLSTYFFCC